MMHYHNYIQVSQTEDGAAERCTECGHRIIVTTGEKGRINNAEYLKEHVRDTAQPRGRTENIFKRFYTNKK